MNEQQRRGRRTLLLIAAIFFVPIALAMLLYFTNSSLIPGSSTVRGQLINPPISLPSDSLGVDDSNAELRELWTLLVLADKQCDSVCQEALEHIRQIRLSLGPKMIRMQTVFMPAVAAAGDSIDLDKHPALLVADPDASRNIRVEIGSWQNGEIMLVDPMGNLMMRYAPGTDMGDVRKDLGHLFNLSTIG